MQIDSLNELPKDKRPPDDIIWNGTSRDLDDWLDRVFDRKKSNDIEIPISEIEG